MESTKVQNLTRPVSKDFEKSTPDDGRNHRRCLDPGIDQSCEDTAWELPAEPYRTVQLRPDSMGGLREITGTVDNYMLPFDFCSFWPLNRMNRIETIRNQQ